MSRGLGRWQRHILAALAERGLFKPVWVATVGLDLLDRSMTLSEYRALLRAAWLLKRRGSLHLYRRPGLDYRDRSQSMLVAWTCGMCSPVRTGEHIPAQPCFWCKTPTTGVSWNGRSSHADCGCRERHPEPQAKTLLQLNNFYGDLLGCVMEGTAPGVISVATG